MSKNKLTCGRAGVLIGYFGALLWMTQDLFSWFGLTDADYYICDLISFLLICVSIALILTYQEESALVSRNIFLKNFITIVAVGLLYLLGLNQYVIYNSNGYTGFMIDVQFWLICLLLAVPFYVANKNNEVRLALFNFIMTGTLLLIYLTVQYEVYIFVGVSVVLFSIISYWIVSFVFMVFVIYAIIINL